MLNVTFRQLEVFAGVARTGGFGSAAAALDIAQTSVSAHIQAIELQLGQKVFLRRPGRRPVLTEFGDALYDHAQRILAEVDALNARLSADRGTRHEQIVFACQRSIAHTMLPRMLARFAQAHPKVELVTRVGSQEEVIWQQQNGIAAAACFLSNEDTNALGSTAIGSERYVIVAKPDHALAGRKRITAAEIERYPFVGPPQNSMFGKSLTRILNEAGVHRINVLSRATEYPILRQLVIAGIGIACSAAKSVAQDVANKDMVVLPFGDDKLRLGVRLLVSETPRPTAAMRSFIDEIRDCWKADAA
jgi:DNA-binding transcriptional LysR family regulator